jgi:transposase
MNNRTLIAIDLAKYVFQVCRLSKSGKVVYNKLVSRKQLHSLLANSAPGIVAFEACGSAHYWGRVAQSHGHNIRMLPAKLVKSFRQGHKTDKTDALAIAHAASHPDIKGCQLKTVEQQIVQSVETSRQFIGKQSRALSNNIRALVYEYGLTIAKGQAALFKAVPEILEDAENGFPHVLRATLFTLYEQLKEQVKCLKQLNKEKTTITKTIEPCQRLEALEGVGPVAAALLYASIGDGRAFKNGRAASTYVGMTPQQHSSGGKTVIVGINKQGGDKMLRAVLYQGALSVISRLPDIPTTEKQRWLIALVQRVGVKRACIALANKTVRTAWALLSSGEAYRPKMITY